MPVVIQVHEEIIHDVHGNPKGIIGELYQDGEVQFKINAANDPGGPRYKSLEVVFKP